MLKGCSIIHHPTTTTRQHSTVQAPPLERWPARSFLASAALLWEVPPIALQAGFSSKCCVPFFKLLPDTLLAKSKVLVMLKKICLTIEAEQCRGNPWLISLLLFGNNDKNPVSSHKATNITWWDKYTDWSVYNLPNLKDDLCLTLRSCSENLSFY